MFEPSSCIIVTGAAGAIGGAVVRYLTAQGARVAAFDRGDAAERLRALSAELGKACLAVPGDVSSAADWAQALVWLEKELGPPTGAALIAGGWRGGAPLHEEPDDQVWRAMLDSNLETVHRSLRALLPGMTQREQGSIVVVGSRAAVAPWTSAGAAAYATSKAAVVALVQAVSAEVLERRVRLNAILPSIVDTPANRRAMPGADPSRWVSPTSIAKVIAFLLSPDSADISGAALPVYGRS